MLVEKCKEITKLEGVLRKFTEQKDGKTMSIAAITSQADSLMSVAKSESLPSSNSSKTKDSNGRRVSSEADKEAADGEIMDDDINPETIRINKLA